MIIKESQQADDHEHFSAWSLPPAAKLSSRDSYAEADLLRLSVFFRNNPVPILVCSPDGDVIKLNPAAEKMLRRQPGLRETELLPTNHQGLVQACLAEKSKERTVEHTIGGDRQARRVFAITYNAVPSFKLVYLYIVDITEYRQAEDDFLQVAATTLDVVKLAVMQLRSMQRSLPQRWRWHWGLQDFESEPQADTGLFVTMDGCVYANSPGKA